MVEVLTLFLDSAPQNKAQWLLRLPASSPLRVLPRWPPGMAQVLEQMIRLAVEAEVLLR
jgi:hypothetical protein